MYFAQPTDQESYNIEAAYLRQKAMEAQQQMLSNPNYNRITGDPTIFEQAARRKEAYGAAPNSSPQAAMTPGIMNMMLSQLGPQAGGINGPQFMQRMQGWMKTAPSFSMSPRGGRGGYQEEQEIDPRLQRAMRDPHDPGRRVYDLGGGYRQLAQSHYGYNPLQGLAQNPQHANALQGYTQAAFGNGGMTDYMNPRRGSGNATV